MTPIATHRFENGRNACVPYALNISTKHGGTLQEMSTPISE